MTFYLKPPDGSIPVYKFEQFVESRLQFLLSILDNPEKSLSEVIKICQLRPSQLDCLLQGTPKDRVSHFALRTAVITNFALERVVHNGEKLLFEKRLKHTKVQEMEISIKSFARHLNEYKHFFSSEFKKHDYTKYVEVSYRTLGKILSRKLLSCSQSWASNAAEEIADSARTLCSVHGDSHILKVPFTHALEFIGSREVYISNGVAHLTCAQVPRHLSSLFIRVLESSSYTMRKSVTLRKSFAEDSRFADISRKLRKIFQSHNQFGNLDDNGNCWLTSSRLLPAGNRMTLQTLDFEASQFFPPCMRNHYSTLRRTHRLPHAARFQFTLFLKDIGLSVEDCINMLRQEYSKSLCDVSTPNSQSSVSSVSSVVSSPGKCSHSWDKDKHRYVYGTRHMYGLEGARKNYSSHSCTSMIKDTATGCSDGCPFVDCHQNALFLKNIEADLENHDLGPNIPEFLSSLKNETRTPPIESCHVYLNFKRQKLKSAEAEIKTDDKTASMSKSSGSSSGAGVTGGAIGGVDGASFRNCTKPSHFYMILKNTAIS